MNFWSKGLGKKTIDLHLGKGEAHPGAEHLYVKGNAEAPISWEYIMALRGEDFVDVLALLREPAMADSIYSSPDRWRLLGKLIAGGIHVGCLVAVAAVRLALGKSVTGERVELELPPPSEKKRKRRVRARLGSKRISSADNVSADSMGAIDDLPEVSSAEGKRQFDLTVRESVYGDFRSDNHNDRMYWPVTQGENHD